MRVIPDPVSATVSDPIAAPVEDRVNPPALVLVTLTVPPPFKIRADASVLIGPILPDPEPKRTPLPPVAVIVPVDCVMAPEPLAPIETNTAFRLFAPKAMVPLLVVAKVI